MRTAAFYAKVRSAAVGGVSIIGIARGAGMIEPDEKALGRQPSRTLRQNRNGR